ncbi:MAG: type IV secretion system protein [Pseudomonadota bacterium]
MISSACAPIDPRDGLVSPLLDQVDCQIAYYVEATYGSLFGPFGFLEPVLTAALTIYIAFYGLQLMMGRGGVSLSGLAPKVVVIGLVLTLATRWDAYQVLFFDLVYGGAGELAALMIGEAPGGQGAREVFTRLDLVLRDIIALASDTGAAAAQRPDAVPSAVPPVAEAQMALPGFAGLTNLLWFSGVALALSTVGVLVITKILLGLLLAIGPVLIVMALFSATRGLFEGWLRTLALYALTPVFALALTAGVLHAAEPLVRVIAEARVMGDANPQPVFLLAVIMVIFSILTVQIFRMCAHLTGGWRLPAGRIGGARDAGAPQPFASPAERAANDNGRIADIVVAADRSAAVAAQGRTRAMAQSPNLGVSSDPTVALAGRRTRQRYRAFGERLGAGGRLT